MSVLTAAAVGAAIAIGFYFLNKEAAEARNDMNKLKQSTAMVFILCTGVLILATILGLGGETLSKAAAKPIKGGFSDNALPFDYVLGGEPPF